MTPIKMIKKLIKARKEKRLFSTFINNNHISKYLSYILGFQYLLKNPAKGISIQIPRHKIPNEDDKELVERIFNSFIKMKDKQKSVNSESFVPSLIWQRQLDGVYHNLSSSYKENNIDKFHYFLYNFGSWGSNIGIENAPEILRGAYFTRKLYIENNIFLKNFKIWKWFYKSNHRDISKLWYPQHGNQVGADLNGQFVGYSSFANDIYASNLINLLSDNPRPIIADLGAGYGRFDYFVLRDFKKFTFIDFDLPEVVVLAAYYLMKTWPNKKALLFGEKNYSGAIHKDYELIFMPNYEIVNIGKNNIDLFINKNSLGEMNKDTVNQYLKFIFESTKYFFHMNHEHIRRLGNNSLLANEYPIPPNFRLIYKFPDFRMLIANSGILYSEDIFLYLYEKFKPNLNKKI